MLCRQLHQGDIYAGFRADDYPVDVQGWHSEDPIFRKLLAAVRPRIVVELGTWKGASALHMCALAKELDLDPFTIVCVDTFLGSTWHWLNRQDPSGFAGLACRHGYPSLYYKFLANVVHLGHQDRVVPFPNTTTNASRFFNAMGGPQPDLVYVDAGHNFNDVVSDLRHWWPLVRPGGTVFGDDFSANFPGVEQALRTFCAEMRLAPVHVEGEKWVLQKPGP
jgi:predicted O-methyltransferase YrrM